MNISQGMWSLEKCDHLKYLCCSAFFGATMIQQEAETISHSSTKILPTYFLQCDVIYYEKKCCTIYLTFALYCTGNQISILLTAVKAW